MWLRILAARAVAAVRVWARENGYDVKDRAMPADLVAKYQEAMGR